MKKLLILTLVLFSTLITAQTCETFNDGGAFKKTVAKDGKITVKECHRFTLCKEGGKLTAAEFRATYTSVMTLYRITDEKWESEDGKVWLKYKDEEGRLTWEQNDKLKFYIETK